MFGVNKLEKIFHPLLEGSFDFHVHSSPSIFERKQNDWEVIADAIEAQMGGLVLKSHESSTVERAYLINEVKTSIQVFGGIVLNNHVGGLNPYAVETALKMGGKIVWFPTISTRQHHHYFSNKHTKLFNGDPNAVNSTINIQQNGKLTNEAIEILYQIKEFDAVLATGHLSLEETHILIKYALDIGVEKILIQHADMGISKIPMEDQLYFASKGCIIEKCYLACSSDFHDLSIDDMANTINKIGYKNCILVTDYGQPHNEPPVHAFNRFVEELLSAGINEQQLTWMIKNNPKSLLGL